MCEYLLLSGACHAGHTNAVKKAVVISASEEESEHGKRKRDNLSCTFVTASKDGTVRLWKVTRPPFLSTWSREWNAPSSWVIRYVNRGLPTLGFPMRKALVADAEKPGSGFRLSACVTNSSSVNTQDIF